MKAGFEIHMIHEPTKSTDTIKLAGHFYTIGPLAAELCTDAFATSCKGFLYSRAGEAERAAQHDDILREILEWLYVAALPFHPGLQLEEMGRGADYPELSIALTKLGLLTRRCLIERMKN